MKWHLYKKDDPNTWPQIDCPMVVYYPYKQYHDSDNIIFIGHWDNDRKQFFTPKKWWDEKELYYAYVGYVPSGYKTYYPTRCTREDNNRCEYDDDGYCMLEGPCPFSEVVPEYGIEEKVIWKEFA